MKKVLIAVLTAGLFSLAAVPRASAQIVNGGFETGDLTGWNTTSDLRTGVQTSSFGSGPTQGTYDALIDNGGNYTNTPTETFNVDASTLDTDLGLNLSNLSNLGAYDGNAIYQSVNIAAGQTLSFDWNYLTTEAQNNGYDFGFAAIGGNVIELANSYSSMTSANTTFYSSGALQTGFNTYHFLFNTGGTYTIGFGAVNTVNNLVHSGLLVDNVQLTGGQVSAGPVIPEPGTVWLFAIGLIGAALLMKRRFGVATV